MSKKNNLLGLTREELQDYLIKINEKPYRGLQIFEWIHNKGVIDFDSMTNLGKELIEKLKQNSIIEIPEIVDNRWQEYFKKPDAKLSKWMTLIDLKIRLPELLLMRMDKLVMQSGVETRVPFLDHKFVEFILSIPEPPLYQHEPLQTYQN